MEAFGYNPTIERGYTLDDLKAFTAADFLSEIDYSIIRDLVAEVERLRSQQSSKEPL